MNIVSQVAECFDDMTKPNLTKALAELNMCKQFDIKPNFSELSRKTGIDRHTLKKYYERGGKFDK